MYIDSIWFWVVAILALYGAIKAHNNYKRIVNVAKLADETIEEIIPI